MAVRVKYQVFVSSTFVDLREERLEAARAILEARHIPAGMENFPATDDRGWKVIQRTIDECDYYVLILGFRYGSLAPDQRVSWTEREYDYARERGLSVLTFLRDERGGVPSVQHVDTNRKRIDGFRERVRKAHLCKTWNTLADVRGQVRHALQDQIAQDEMDDCLPLGWYRGDQVATARTMNQLAELVEENRDLRTRLEEARAASPRLTMRLRVGEPDGKWVFVQPEFAVESTAASNLTVEIEIPGTCGEVMLLSQRGEAVSLQRELNRHVDRWDTARWTSFQNHHPGATLRLEVTKVKLGLPVRTMAFAVRSVGGHDAETIRWHAADGDSHTWEGVAEIVERDARLSGGMAPSD